MVTQVIDVNTLKKIIFLQVLPILTGVLWGSNLGPFLFLIYINDLPKQYLISKLTLFADATNIVNSSFLRKSRLI